MVCYRCRLHRWQICCRCRWYQRQFTTDVVYTSGKFSAGIVDTAILPPESTTLAKLVAKFAASVFDTGGAPWLATIFANFWKKFETVLMGYSGAGGNWYMKKTRSKNSRDTVPWFHTVGKFNLFSWIKKFPGKSCYWCYWEGNMSCISKEVLQYTFQWKTRFKCLVLQPPVPCTVR